MTKRLKKTRKRDSSDSLISRSKELPEELKLPSNIIKIGPYDYIVRYMDIITVDSTDMIGTHLSEYRIIQLATCLDRFSLVQTLMHEINHAIMDVLILKKKRSEDDFCEIFSSGWIMVYRDNPWLFDWIQKLLFREE